MQALLVAHLLLHVVGRAAAELAGPQQKWQGRGRLVSKFAELKVAREL